MGSLGTILQSGNTHRVAQASWEGQLSERVANNNREASNMTLAEFSRTMSNQVRMEGAGKEYNAATSRLAHELEQAGKGKVNLQLQNAEARGALEAQAGLYGVGGATVELMDGLTELKHQTQQEEIERMSSLMSGNVSTQNALVMSNAANQLNLGQIMGQFDYSSQLKPHALSNKWLKVAGVLVATYFGGPQAGEAAADAAVGEWKAQNGDFGGASDKFGSALTNAGRAYQQWGERGGTSWGSNAFGGNTNTQTGNSTSGGGWTWW